MPREPPSPPVFLLISAHFTATPGIPFSPAYLQSARIESKPPVKPVDFTPDATNRLRALYAQQFRTTLAPYVLPRLLARSWPVLLLHIPSPTPHVESASSVLKEVYNPKAVIPHAALLDQASAHCPIFPTAASRRSLGRVSVPVWPVTLSGRLPVEALVGHSPTNNLIGREHIPGRKNFPPTPMPEQVVSGISHRFRWLSQSQRQITHVLLPRSPLEYPRRGLSARLACVKHAASVRPEPGSNSPLRILRVAAAWRGGQLLILVTVRN